jgi:hypothetical protein
MKTMNQHCARSVSCEVVTVQFIPSKWRVGRPRMYPYHELDTGKSLVISGMRSSRAISGNVSAYARKSGKRFAVRKIKEDAVMVTRTA